MTISLKHGAQALVRGTGVALDFLSDASRHLGPLTRIPLFGETVLELQDLIAMLHDYYHGRYKKVPAVVIVGATAIAAYLVSPYDLIPDKVPILGFIDDAFIINIVMQLCIDRELERYRAWRALNV